MWATLASWAHYARCTLCRVPGSSWARVAFGGSLRLVSCECCFLVTSGYPTGHLASCLTMKSRRKVARDAKLQHGDRANFSCKYVSLLKKKKKVPLHWGKRHMTVLTISRCVVQQCEMCAHFCVTSRTFSFLKKLELSTHVCIFIFKLLSNF